MKAGQLGQGGMAEVFEFRDQYFQRPVAYKTLKVQRRERRHIAEFVREARVMGQLEHPGVVTVHQLLKDPEGMPGITMALAEGETLSVRIQKAEKNQDSWLRSDRVNLFARLVEVVAYAHHERVVHRDLKPSNIIVGQHGEVTLLDWGLAKVVEKAESVSEQDANALAEEKPVYESLQGVIKGTPLYMSPEAAKGQTHLVNEMNDIFALGVILFEMLTCKHLIVGKTAQEILGNAAEGNYHWEILDGLKLPKDLVYILKKCLRTNPYQRYESADALRKDIYAFQNGLWLSDFSRDWMLIFRKWLRRHWFLFLLFIFVLSSLVAPTIWLSRQKKDFDVEVREQMEEMVEIQVEEKQWRNRVMATEGKIKQLDKERSHLETEHQRMDSSLKELQRLREDVERLKRETDFGLAEAQRELLSVEKELAEAERLFRQRVEEFKAHENSEREGMRDRNRELLIDMAPDMATRMREADRQKKEGDWLEAGKIMSLLPGDAHAVEILASHYYAGQVQRIPVDRLEGFGPPGEETIKRADDKGLAVASKRMLLPGVRWVYDLPMTTPAGWLMIGASGEMVFNPQGRKNFEVLATHPVAPLQLRRVGEGLCGLYRPNEAFLQVDLRQPPQRVRLPFEAENVWSDGERLAVSRDDLVMIYQRQGKFLEPGKVKGLSKVQELIKSEPTREPELPAVDSQGLKWLSVDPGSRRVLAAMVPGYAVLRSFLGDPTHEPENWSWNGRRVEKAFASPDGNWILLDREGELTHLQPSRPPRSILLDSGAKAVSLFAIPELNLALVETSQQRLQFYLINVGTCVLEMPGFEHRLTGFWLLNFKSLMFDTEGGPYSFSFEVD